MDPDTHTPGRAQRQRPNRLHVAGACALACLIIGALFYATRPVSHLQPVTTGRLPSVTPTRYPTVTTPANAETNSAFSQTCSDSRAWEQQGGTELIDGYINNQDPGNINVDDMKAGCPQYLPTWQKAQGGIPDGESFAVPAEVKPGTYETTSSDLENCYWERSRGGKTVDNRFITASKVKQRVTIRQDDDTFVTKGCGNWVKVG